MDVTSAYGEVVADEAARDTLATERGLGPNDANFVVQFPDGRVDRWTGSTWVTKLASGGAVGVSDAALALGPIYNDGTYKYFGEALAGTATTAAAWRVSRMNIATSQVQWVDSGNFSQVYNVEATIAALTYV